MNEKLRFRTPGGPERTQPIREKVKKNGIARKRGRESNV